MNQNFKKTLRKTGYIFLGFLPAMAAHAEEKIQLTLQHAMDMAEKKSFDRRIAQESENEVNATKHQYLRSMLPNLSGTLDYQKYDDNVNKAIGNSTAATFGVPKEHTLNGALTVTQPIIALARLFFTVEAYSENEVAAIHKKNLSKVEARLSGASLFLNTQKSNRLLEVAKASVEVAQKQLQDANAQFQAGRITKTDVLKIKLNLEDTKNQLRNAETTHNVALLSLAEALGVNDASDFEFPADNDKSYWENSKNTTITLKKSLKKATENRLDLKAIDHSIKAYSMSKYASYAAYLPDLNFMASYTRNFEATTVRDSAGTLLFPKSDIQDNFIIGLHLDWNIWDFGVRQAQIDQIAAQRESTIIQKEQLESQSRIQVTSSYYKFEDAIQFLESTRTSEQYAKDVYSQVQAQFLNGQATSTDLITASSSQTLAEANLANAIGDLDIAWLTLDKDTGGKLVLAD